MAKRQFDHFLNLSQLLTNTTNVVISDIIDVLFLLFALDRSSFAVDNSVGSNDTNGRGIAIDNLEFNGSHRSSDAEHISLVNWTVSFQEVRLEEYFKYIACKSLDSVVDGQNVDVLSVLDVRGAVDTAKKTNKNVSIYENCPTELVDLLALYGIEALFSSLVLFEGSISI